MPDSNKEKAVCESKTSEMIRKKPARFVLSYGSCQSISNIKIINEDPSQERSPSQDSNFHGSTQRGPLSCTGKIGEERRSDDYQTLDKKVLSANDTFCLPM
jgi:hypothetical protein